VTNLGRDAESKQRMHRFHVERFSLKKLIEVEGREQYWIEISNRFTALGNLDAEVDINTLRTGTLIFKSPCGPAFF
jgi:hypothetical protein